MANVTSKKLLIFVSFLLVFPLFVHPLDTHSAYVVRRLLKNPRPHETAMKATTGSTNATTHQEFHAAAHEVPSGPNPESNK
ncbi:hypothetical protein QVD17_37691 [Tagetes erecta]|uniref:Uncharacterized protein n=1 Tax=Tagetes erecta TaxID=13708 RepID=A0AAD8JYS1_TARER|nr:hypothetical protein QVD17_37691 [Tagetes erecta]